MKQPIVSSAATNCTHLHVSATTFYAFICSEYSNLGELTDSNRQVNTDIFGHIIAKIQ
jgi:hypothetical protein